jgi:hypothetical protein
LEFNDARLERHVTLPNLLLQFGWMLSEEGELGDSLPVFNNELDLKGPVCWLLL